MKRALIFALILGIPATVTAADYSCNFDQECYDSESCADSDFNVEVRGSDEKIATDFGTFRSICFRPVIPRPGLPRISPMVPKALPILEIVRKSADGST